MICWSYSWFHYLQRGLLSYYSRLPSFGRLECDWVLFSAGFAVSSTKICFCFLIYFEILTKVTQSFIFSNFQIFRFESSSKYHHSQSVAGWSCFFCWFLGKQDLLQQHDALKKTKKTAFTLDLPIELAKCCLFWKGVKKFTNFLRFFFWIGKIRPFKVLQWYQPTFDLPPRGPGSLPSTGRPSSGAGSVAELRQLAEALKREVLGRPLAFLKRWGIMEVVVFCWGDQTRAQIYVVILMDFT